MLARTNIKYQPKTMNRAVDRLTLLTLLNPIALIIRAIFVIALIKGLQAGIAYQKERAFAVRKRDREEEGYGEAPA